MSEPRLEYLPVGDLVPHPDNPRLSLREDVIERITAEIERDKFGAQHAIHTRPHSGKFQIIAGHHRAEAARRAGVDVIPAWVEDMDDDEAFMQLVLSNSQGELTPLEIGMHALKAVPLAQGSRSGSGLSAYAERIGRSDDSLRQWRAAAQVASQLPDTCREVADRHRNLFEISKAPKVAWPALVDTLAKRGWTVADTAAEVGTIKRIAEMISDDDAEWLPLAEIVKKYLSGGKPGPAAVEKLGSTAATVFSAMDTNEYATNADRYEFEQWLVDNRGGDAWDHRKINEYYARLIREWADRAAEAAVTEEEEPPQLPEGVDLRVGPFQTALSDLPAGSVDAIITDPPYPEEFLPLFTDLAEQANRILKPGGVCAVMVGQSYLPEIMERLGSHLTYHWVLSYDTPGGQAVQLWQRKVNTFWKPVLLFTKGEYAGDWIGDKAVSNVNDNDKNHHFWGQSESGTADLVNRLSKPGWTVCDPFLGGGTTAVVCHELGRKFVGCDIEQSCVDTTISRFVKEEEAA